MIEQDKISNEAFFLYAETYLPSEKTREDTLAALQLCADGTSRLTPDVATYVFRPSKLAAMLGERVFPDSVSLESTELYLTHKGFRDHLTTDEFRSGLRSMYKGTRRLGARLFWIGAKPASDMMHNIFRSDPIARPIATIQQKLFDASVYQRTANRDVVILSLLCPVTSGQGAVAIDCVDAMAAALETISFVAFFHPLAPDLLRVFMTAPIDYTQSVDKIAEAVGTLAANTNPEGPLQGHCQTHRTRPDLAEQLRGSFSGQDADWEISSDGYSGYISHEAVSTTASG